LASFREHWATFREHLASFREHWAPADDEEVPRSEPHLVLEDEAVQLRQLEEKQHHNHLMGEKI
jgi:hypothetical protein